MVSSEMAPPPKPVRPETSMKISSKEILQVVRHPPRCLQCDGEVSLTGTNDDGGRWCESCKSFQTVYRGPPRPNLCDSCFNCVGKEKGKSLCAAMKYQMTDGTWRDRYNQAERSEYRQGGMDRVLHPIKPTAMSTIQYVCECYELLPEGETRESIQINDPLCFYSRARFFD